MKNISIGDVEIGEGCGLFITAEIGVTCKYEMDQTKKLISAAKAAGADSVKFNFIFPEESYSDKEMTFKFEVEDGVKEKNFYKEMEKLQFSLDEWMEVKRYCDEKDIIMFGSVGTKEAVDYANKMELPAMKTGSWSWNNYPLWNVLSEQNVPILMDTGPAYKNEISDVVQMFKSNNKGDIMLVHCYHTDDVSQMNMKSIPYMRKIFGCPVGFSSPGRKIDRDIVAVAYGASFIEKRLTLSTTDPEAHHHAVSLEPDEFKRYTSRMRDVQKSIGEEDIMPSKKDKQLREKWFRQIVADKDIEKGSKLTMDDMRAKRPYEGVSPKFINIFKGFSVNKSIEYNEKITWDDLR